MFWILAPGDRTSAMPAHQHSRESTVHTLMMAGSTPGTLIDATGVTVYGSSPGRSTSL